MLPLETFKTVVASTPLISIDLVVRDSDGRVLLGKRTNRPAKGYWFVPGGRIRKNETIEQAWQRLLSDELGLQGSIQPVQFLGVFQHFYDDNVTGAEFSTHYVVLAYEFTTDESTLALPTVQHSEYRWFSEAELLRTSLVHRHAQWYLQVGNRADDAICQGS